MIGYLKGKLLYYIDNNFILEVNGVGYEVCCSASASEYLLQNGGGEIYTYTAVREDGIYLYGFSSVNEKEMFLKLITVSGIGPKLGISILSGMSLSGLALAIATSDVKTLSKVKGCGKKTAERIVLELREKVTADGQAQTEETPLEAKDEKVDEDAVIALMSLGFNRNESINAIKTAISAGAKTIQEILGFALRSMK